MSTCFHAHTNFESSSTFSSLIERVLSPTHGISSPTRHTTKDLTHLALHTPHRDPNDRPSAHVDRARSQTSNFTLDSKLSPRSSQACGPIIAAMGSVTLDVYPRSAPSDRFKKRRCPCQESLRRADFRQVPERGGQLESGISPAD